MFKRTKLSSAAALALGGLAAVVATTVVAQEAQRIEVTGSRLKRTDAEGALPVQVIDRATIEASGQVSVSELMREITFASFGNFRPQSGSSAQALSDIDLRGLGSNRTLVLVDGRRIAKAPFSGQSQDLNSVPLAAVERIEILSDGASAIYGSDAIGGVVNIITRKNYNGFQAAYGQSSPDIVGGDTEQLSLMWGASSNKGRVLAGISSQTRDMIFTRNQIGGAGLGISTFGNNYRRLNPAGAPTGAHTPVPGFACASNNFYFTAPGQAGNICSFNFNAIAANEAQIGNKSVFGNGEFNINDNWSIYANASATKIESFGRYAPTPVQVTLSPTSAPYLAITAATPGLAAASPNGLSLRHRMAAAGPRDNNTDADVIAGLVGIKGRVFDRVDLDFGVRKEKYNYLELGENYIVRPLLEAAIQNGSYDIFNPFGTSDAVLKGVKATITRDSIWDTQEAYGTASTELFKIGNRAATGLIGLEGRKEYYQDKYDPLQEAGLIEGSAGNTAAGSRRTTAAFFEAAFPLLKNLELSIAGRYDKYNDVGSRFSPKAAIRFQPVSNLTLRASAGQGFRAPTLDILTQQPAFSADSVSDLRTCIAFGRTPAQCGDANNDGVIDGTQPQIQVDATVIANAALKPETSKQWNIGAVYEPINWLNLSLDIWNTKINGRIVNTTSQNVINRAASGNPIPGLSVTRDPVTQAITNVTRGAINEGTLDQTGFNFTARTDFRLGAWGRLQNTLQWTQTEKHKVDGDEFIGDQGFPKYRLNLGNRWVWDRLDANLSLNYIAKQPGDPDPVLGEPSTKAYHTVNASLTYRHPTKTTITVGVLNIENKKPELLTYDGRPWNFYLYDALGRQVYFRLMQEF
jgi:iron complex outermembrane recepter protein